MKPLARIPLVDLRGYTPLELLFLFRRQAKALAAGCATILGRPAAPLARQLLRLSDRASRRWLERAENPYTGEIGLIAEAVGVSGAYTLNLCLEWCCTGGVWRGDDGPLLRRVLDWPFPGMGEYIVVAHFSGKLGDFFSVTWPGFSGILQGMAPGRFAAAINQAPLRKRGGGLIGDWLSGRVKLDGNLALPPSHLLRRVFETARDYAAAKAMLCLTPLAVPAIFLLSGTRPGEGCVIERSEDGYEVRELCGGRVAAANQFESNLGGTGWRPRPIDSPARFAAASALPHEAEGFAWFTPPIANANSRLAMTANAATRALSVLGTLGPQPVTERFDLPA